MVRVDAPDEEEDEDEATRERVCVDEDEMSERVDEPVKFRQWHHTGLKPLPEKGETLGMLAAILYIPASCWDSDPILRGIRRPHPAYSKRPLYWIGPSPRSFFALSYTVCAFSGTG